MCIRGSVQKSLIKYFTKNCKIIHWKMFLIVLLFISHTVPFQNYNCFSEALTFRNSPN